MSANSESARDSLADLNEAELGILTKLIRLLVRSDGEISGSERAQVDRIATDSGKDNFWALIDAAAASAQDEAAILKEAEMVASKDAKELIYGSLYELSIVDASGDGENELLVKLAALWGLVITDVKPEASST